MVMGLSCRVFGYGTWQMMLPLVAAALGTIWILHSSVKRVFGHGAAADRRARARADPDHRRHQPRQQPGHAARLPDGRAAPPWPCAPSATAGCCRCVGSAVCFGLAFNTKMLQGYIALPAVFAVYLYAAQLGWLKRVVQPRRSPRVALAVSSFWWAAAVSLVPAVRPALHRRLDGRHRLEPDHGLQRPGPRLRRRGQRRRWRRRRRQLRRDRRHRPDVQRHARRPDLLAAPLRGASPSSAAWCCAAAPRVPT